MYVLPLLLFNLRVYTFLAVTVPSIVSFYTDGFQYDEISLRLSDAEERQIVGREKNVTFLLDVSCSSLSGGFPASLQLSRSLIKEKSLI